MSIDYRTLLAEAYEIWVRYPPKVRGLSFEDILLGTRIPGLPVEATFADLLRWGENVAKAWDEGRPYHYVHVDGHNKTSNAHTLLAALRTEADAEAMEAAADALEAAEADLARLEHQLQQAEEAATAAYKDAEAAEAKLASIDARLRRSSYNLGSDIHRILHPKEGQ